MNDLTERETLALEMHRTPEHPGGYGWQAYLPMADRVVAAGFRRQGPITDAQVNAAVDAYEKASGGYFVTETGMRAALEAALAADRSES
jgi:hypothetical protein